MNASGNLLFGFGGLTAILRCFGQTVESQKGLCGKFSPKEVPRVIISLITQGTSRGQIFKTIPEGLPQLFRLLDLNRVD